jgi:hypothetical protein
MIMHAHSRKSSNIRSVSVLCAKDEILGSLGTRNNSAWERNGVANNEQDVSVIRDLEPKVGTYENKPEVQSGVILASFPFSSRPGLTSNTERVCATMEKRDWSLK